MRRAAAAVDVVAVILFVSIGRASHDHGESVGGFLSTVWPFAVGLGIGWLCVSRWRPGSFRTGLVVCLSTVAVGMVLRLLAGQGMAAAFIVVALSFLGVLMIGGRLLLGQAKRRLA